MQIIHIVPFSAMDTRGASPWELQLWLSSGLLLDILKHFLAQLVTTSWDYQIAQASVVRPSVRRPSVVRLWHGLEPAPSELLSSNLLRTCLLAVSPGVFFIFSKFWNLEFWRIFSDFLIMGVYGTENFKTLLLLQFFMDQFQTISPTTWGGPSQNLFLRILNLAFIKILKLN